MTSADPALDLSLLARSSPAALAWVANLNRETGVSTWKLPPHLALLNRRIQELVALELQRDGYRGLIVEAPPRHGKSELCSHYLPAWFLGLFPHKRVALASYEADFAATWGRKARSVLEEFGPSIFGVEVDPRSSAANRWEVRPLKGKRSNPGGMITTGIGGPLTGAGANILCIDDATKNAAEAHSKTRRQAIWDWFVSTAMTRLEPDGVVLVIMTRWHHDDLAGRLLKQMETGEGDRWLQIRLPAIAEENDVLGRTPGEALWPERFPAEVLERSRRALGSYVWSCTPGETPITMSDWTHKRIDQVRAGDEVVGFKHGNKDARSQLLRSRVLAVHTKMAEVVAYETETGKYVRCTDDHNWWTGRHGERREYAPIRVGSVARGPTSCSKLMLVDEGPHRPMTQREFELWTYLAAIVDGEGSIQDSAVLITQAVPRNAPVIERVKEVLNELGLSFHLSFGAASDNWSAQETIGIHNPRHVLRCLLRVPLFAKREQALARLWRRPHMPIMAKERVVAVGSRSYEAVYALTTETGNYIANGFASSNSLYQQRPSTLSGGMFDHDQIVIVPEIPGKVKRMVRFWDLAGTEAGGDYTVGLLMARLSDNRHVIADVRRGQFASQELENLIMSTAQADGPNVRIRMEQERGSAGKLLVDHYKRLLTGYDFKGVWTTGDKVLRARPLSACSQRGELLIVRADWNTDLLEEYVLFDHGAYDDQVDAGSGAFEVLRKSGGMIAF